MSHQTVITKLLFFVTLTVDTVHRRSPNGCDSRFEHTLCGLCLKKTKQKTFTVLLR
jgi:hypothetical protein